MERNCKSLNTLHWKLIRKLSWPKDHHPESTFRRARSLHDGVILTAMITLKMYSEPEH